MKEIRTDNFIIRLHSPEITEEENRFRMKQIRKAAEMVLITQEKERRVKNEVARTH